MSAPPALPLFAGRRRERRFGRTTLTVTGEALSCPAGRPPFVRAGHKVSGRKEIAERAGIPFRDGSRNADHGRTFFRMTGASFF